MVVAKQHPKIAATEFGADSLDRLGDTVLVSITLADITDRNEALKPRWWGWWASINLRRWPGVRYRARVAARLSVCASPVEY
jgi:hypothetical protein